MQINRIAIYRVALNYAGGSYAWGRGNVVTTAHSTVVVVDTDAGVSGVGEFCPCGENYMDAHSEGVEAAARLIAPQLIGVDPRQVARIMEFMDRTVGGHGYAKAPFDAACWDILGKSLGQPVWMLLGGWLTDGAPLYRVAPQRAPAEMAQELVGLREQGYRQFQVKVGRDWREDIDRLQATVPLLEAGEVVLADANQGWTVDEAIRVARATKDLDYIMEQPCKTYEECMQVRQMVDRPLKLDECVNGLGAVTRVATERSAEVVCLKISNLGGLSKARLARDFLVAHRFKVVCEDTWGGEITTAALAHLAISTPEDFLLNTTDLHNYNNESTGHPPPRIERGRMFVPDAPGLGVEPDFTELGEAVAEYSG